MPKGAVKIVVERCKACGFCVEFCPTNVLALSSAFNSKGYHPPHVVAADKCSGCEKNLTKSRGGVSASDQTSTSRWTYRS